MAASKLENTHISACTQDSIDIPDDIPELSEICLIQHLLPITGFPIHIWLNSIATCHLQ